MVRGATACESTKPGEPAGRGGVRCYGGPRHDRRLFALLSCVFAAFALAACGEEDNASKSVDELLKATFAGDKSVKSGKLNTQLDANVQGVQGLSGPVRLRLNGPFAAGGDGEMPQFDFTLGLTAGGQSFTAGGVSTGDKGYIKFQGKTYAVSDELFKRFKDGYLKAAQDSKKDKGATPSLGALGVNPRAWLRDAQKAGEENVGGTETIHITAKIDVPRMLDDVNRLLARASKAAGGQGQQQVPSRLTAEQRKQIEDAVQSAEVDIYTGKDDALLRKLDVRVRLKKSGAVDGGNLRFALQFDELNENAEDHPAQGREAVGGAARRPRRRGAAGPGRLGLRRLGLGSGQPTTPAPSGGGGATDEYTKCLQEAGEDIQKLQQCAELLNSGG